MLREIWQSFWRLPGWVLLWVVVVLGPVNFASLLFLNQPLGAWVAGLSLLGVLPNAVLLFVERGVSRIMTLPHLVAWPPLLGLIVWLLGGDAPLAPVYRTYLWCLLVANAISLAFDAVDFRKWLRGAREIY